MCTVFIIIQSAQYDYRPCTGTHKLASTIASTNSHSSYGAPYIMLKATSRLVGGVTSRECFNISISFVIIKEVYGLTPFPVYWLFTWTLRGPF